MQLNEILILIYFNKTHPKQVIYNFYYTKNLYLITYQFMPLFNISTFELLCSQVNFVGYCILFIYNVFLFVCLLLNIILLKSISCVLWIKFMPFYWGLLLYICHSHMDAHVVCFNFVGRSKWRITGIIYILFALFCYYLIFRL